MSPAPARPEVERRSSGGALRNALHAVGRRFSTQKSATAGQDRRKSSTVEPITTHASSEPEHEVQDTHLDPVPPSPSTSTSEVSSWAQPVAKINSQSPASEIPQTWAEWNLAYAKGLIDFNDPPPPPQMLGDSPSQVTASGQYRAPVPRNERQRQRAIDAVQQLQRLDNRRRPSGVAPNQTVEDDRSHSGADSSSGNKRPAADSNDDDKENLGRRSNGSVAPDELKNHPALVRLAQQAREHFKTKGSTVSLMDSDFQVFLAEKAFGGVDKLARDSTICSHTQLKASATGEKDPLVVLNIGEDWRFAKNNFGEYNSGFYAAAPIMLPAPFGDNAGSYPGGVFCVIDEKPRTQFSAEDRKYLEELAATASQEIIKYNREQEDQKRKELKLRRDTYRRNKIVKQASQKSSLAAIEEQSTPPQSPAAVSLEDGFRTLGDSSDGLDGLGSGSGTSSPQADDKLDPGVDGVSEVGSQELGVTEVVPAFPRRRKGGRCGVLAGAQRLSPEMKNVLDLSTQLVGESLDLDFCYVIAVDLGLSDAAPRTASDKPVRLLSGHNVPMPAPLFDVNLHLEALTSRHTAILFNNPEFRGEDGEFSTGLLVKVATVGETGYLLGCFSSNPRRVLSDTDYGFCRSFARDIAQWVQKL